MPVAVTFGAANAIYHKKTQRSNAENPIKSRHKNKLMKHLKIFAALCCAAVLFAACDKSNEPKNDSNDNSNITPSNPDEEVTGDTENGHNYVDLGLPSGTLWATCNVGATAPEEYGDYFAWGETETKTTRYNWSTYKWCNGDYNNLTKYNTYSIFGTVDNKTTLDPEDDAAVVNWGGKWRMPTDDEWMELRETCTWTWTEGYNGTDKNGYEVKSNANGNTIFLPAAGYREDDSLDNAGDSGDYWSSSLCTLSSVGTHSAWGVYFGPGRLYRGYGGRYFGISVRPVFK